MFVQWYFSFVSIFPKWTDPRRIMSVVYNPFACEKSTVACRNPVDHENVPNCKTRNQKAAKFPITTPGCRRSCRAYQSSWAAGLEKRRVSENAHKAAGRRRGRTLVDVGQDTTLGDGNVTQQLVQLLIVADGKLQMSGDDTGLLVVAGGVASQLENLGSEVLEDSGEVDGGTGTDTLGVVALAEQTVDTADGESQTSLGRTAGTGARVSNCAQKGPSRTRTTEARRFEMDASQLKTNATRTRWKRAGYLRLRVLGTAGLAAGLAASSHFDGCVGWCEKKKAVWESEDGRRWRCWRSGVDWLWAEDGLCWLRTRNAVEVQWGRELK